MFDYCAICCKQAHKWQWSASQSTYIIAAAIYYCCLTMQGSVPCAQPVSQLIVHTDILHIAIHALDTHDSTNNTINEYLNISSHSIVCISFGGRVCGLMTDDRLDSIC
jgi:hypothetical protein